MTEQKKPRKNIDISEDVYIAGAGNRMILPKIMPVWTLPRKRHLRFLILNILDRLSYIPRIIHIEMLFGGIITEIPSDVTGNSEV